MELILSGDNINEGRIKINSLSGFSSYWSAGTGIYSMIGNDLTGNTASNDYSFVGGFESVSSGNTSFAFGQNVIAGGNNSFASGYYTTAYGDYSFASGNQTTAIGNYSFTSNDRCKSYGNYSLSLNNLSISSGFCSTSINNRTLTYGDYSFASGKFVQIDGDYSFINSNINGLYDLNCFGNKSAILGGNSMSSLYDDNMVYVSKLNINNISNNNSPTNVLTLEPNGVVTQKGYDTNFINLTGESLTTVIVFEVNKFYSFYQNSPFNYNYLPTTGNTGDVIIVANLSISGIEYITVDGTYNTSIFYGIGNNVGIEITNSISSSDQFELKKGTVIEFTYFGSDVGLDCWVVTKYDTIGKYIGNLDNNTSTNDYDVEYIS
jgi:hypothetical protein